MNCPLPKVWLTATSNQRPKRHPYLVIFPRERLKVCYGACCMVVSVWGLMRTMPSRSETVTYGVPPVRK